MEGKVADILYIPVAGVAGDAQVLVQDIENGCLDLSSLVLEHLPGEAGIPECKILVVARSPAGIECVVEIR